MRSFRIIVSILGLLVSSFAHSQVALFESPVSAEGKNSIYGIWQYYFSPNGLRFEVFQSALSNRLKTDLGKRYRIFLLPTLGGPGGTALRINNQGYVTGSTDNQSWIRHAYLYHSKKMDVPIDLDPGVSQLPVTSEAWGLNDSNDAAGLMLDQSVGRFRAVYFPVGGAPVDLGAPYGVDSFAHSIDNRGRIAGSVRYQGAFWDAQQNMTYLPSPAPYSLAWAISDSGLIGGASSRTATSGYAEQAALWQVDSYGKISGPQYIPEPPGGNGSEVRAINNNGSVVGGVDLGTYGSGYYSAQPNSEEGRTMTLMGLLPEGRYSTALGINDREEVVGIASTNTFIIGLAVYWTPQTGLIDLNSRLVNNSDGQWILVSANSINNRGEIVGYGVYRGGYQAYLLRPVGGDY